jgi:hypothetical protein
MTWDERLIQEGYAVVDGVARRRPKMLPPHLLPPGPLPARQAQQRRATEQEEQRALFDWARLFMMAEPRLALLYHIPNGGKRAKATAGTLKALGVMAGVPDVCLPVASRGYHGAYLELKARQGRPSEAQLGWISALAVQGYCTGVYHGWVSAARHLCWYLDRLDLWRDPEDA